MRLLLIGLVCCFGVALGCVYPREEGTVHWNYGQTPNGVSPLFWFKVNENCGHESNDEFQSPVDIAHTQYDDKLKDLRVSYPVLLSGTVTNNGHTVSFAGDTEESTDNFVLSKGPLGNEEYTLFNVHLHWGHPESGIHSLGSEHTIEGEGYAAEIHIVHKNTKYTKEEFLHHSDGAAVIGILFSVESSANNNYGELFDYISQVTDPGATAEFSLNLSQLLPGNLDYYTYKGSLTAPTCDPAVTWLVLRETVSISLEQLEVLFDVHYEEEGEEIEMGPNNRPIQPLNQRLVTRNFELDDEISNSGGSSSSGSVLVASAFAMFFCILCVL